MPKPCILTIPKNSKPQQQDQSRNNRIEIEAMMSFEENDKRAILLDLQYLPAQETGLRTFLTFTFPRGPFLTMTSYSVWLMKFILEFMLVIHFTSHWGYCYAVY